MNNNYTILDNIPFSIDPINIMEKLHIPLDMKDDFIKLTEDAKKIAHPKACFKMFPLEHTENTIQIENINFPGDILIKNLKNKNRIFLFTATEGTELEEWAKQFDFLELFFVCELRQTILNQVQDYIGEKIQEIYAIPTVSSMNPCGLTIWNEKEQKDFFNILNDIPKSIGITVEENLLMKPQYSASGIFFQSDTKEHNCTFCPNPKCPNRKTPYKNNK